MPVLVVLVHAVETGKGGEEQLLVFETSRECFVVISLYSVLTKLLLWTC